MNKFINFIYITVGAIVFSIIIGAIIFHSPLFIGEPIYSPIYSSDNYLLNSCIIIILLISYVVSSYVFIENKSQNEKN